MSAPKHAPRVPFALLVIALVVGSMALLLTLNTASAANELRRHDIAVKDAGLTGQLQQLRNQVAASEAPAALASAAAALGMVPAANPAFLQIDARGHVRLLGSPVPAAAVLPPPVARPTTASPAHTPAHRHPTTTPTRKPTPTVKKTPKPTTTPTPTQTLPGGPR